MPKPTILITFTARYPTCFAMVGVRARAVLAFVNCRGARHVNLKHGITLFYKISFYAFSQVTQAFFIGVRPLTY
jgi:hypothetical protein